jgi:hypothetical protein
MRFCIFLFEEGLLSADACLLVLRTQSRRTPPLGRLIIKHRFLSMGQLTVLLGKQLESGAPLGQLAVREQLLTEDQLNLLIEQQRKETPAALEIVRELGLLASSRLDDAHQKFLTTLS